VTSMGCLAAWRAALGTDRDSNRKLVLFTPGVT
jgi:hypothetical protein